MSLTVLTVGSVMVDTVAVIPDRDIEKLSLHNERAAFLLVEQGRKVEAESIEIFVGGGAANTAVSFRRQGHDVDTLAAVGDDLNAARIRQSLESEGIGTSLVRQIDGVATGSAVIISAHDHDAAIFINRGANTRLDASHFETLDLGGYDIVYIASLSGESADVFAPLTRKAREAGCFVACNPGIRQLRTRAREVADSLPYIDLLSLNRSEAEAFFEALRQDMGHAGTLDRWADADRKARLLRNGLTVNGAAVDLCRAVSALTARGVGEVLITDGPDGAYLIDGERLHFRPVLPAKPRGTAGAGDAFSSTLVAHRAAGISSADALLAAAVNSASVIGRVDAQSGLLDRGTLEKGIAACSERQRAGGWEVPVALSSDDGTDA